MIYYLDDSETQCHLIKILADKLSIDLKAFCDPAEFINQLPKLEDNSAFLIDYNLGGKITFEEVCSIINRTKNSPCIVCYSAEPWNYLKIRLDPDICFTGFDKPISIDAINEIILKLDRIVEDPDSFINESEKNCA